MFYVPVVHHMSFIALWPLCRSQVSAFPELFPYQQVMNRPYQVSTTLGTMCGVDSFLKDIDLAKIACSCHFVLDLLCYKEVVVVSSG